MKIPRFAVQVWDHRASYMINWEHIRSIEYNGKKGIAGIRYKAGEDRVVRKDKKDIIVLPFTGLYDSNGIGMFQYDIVLAKIITTKGWVERRLAVSWLRDGWAGIRNNNETTVYRFGAATLKAHWVIGNYWSHPRLFAVEGDGECQHLTPRV